MKREDLKCVMVIDDALSVGIIANAIGIMGITLGKYIPEAVGNPVLDNGGYEHLGIIEFPLPILKASRQYLSQIRQRLFEEEFKDLLVVDFSDVAQSCNVYEEYIQKLSEIKKESIQYYGLAICGVKKKVNKLTGSMPLLR